MRADDPVGGDSGTKPDVLMEEYGLKKIFVPGGWVLASICAGVLVLMLAHMVGGEAVRHSRERFQKMETLAAAMPEADDFVGLLSEGLESPIVGVDKALRDGELIGYCIRLAPKGYSGPIDMVVGIEKDGKIRALNILSQTETQGLGSKVAEPGFYGQFEKLEARELALTSTAPADTVRIQAISGATVTSETVVTAVNSALEYWRAYLKDRG